MDAPYNRCTTSHQTEFSRQGTPRPVQALAFKGSTLAAQCATQNEAHLDQPSSAHPSAALPRIAESSKAEQSCPGIGSRQ
jgi:hypothetical protein